MKLQEIYTKYVGEFGKYQLMVICLIFTLRVPSAIHNIGYVFFARTPEHSCSFNRNFHLNFTHEEWKALSVPRNKVTSQWSQCWLYTWNQNVSKMTSQEVNSTIMALNNGETFGDDVKYRCDHWDYDTRTDVQDSVVTQWHLVCGRKWMKALIASMYAVGWMAGSSFTGYLTDRYGRRLLLMITGFMTVILGIINPFVNHYVGFLLVRFFLSAFLNGAQAVAFTTAIEVVGPSKRSLVSNMFMTIWALGYMMVAGVAYLIRDRFAFMIATAAPTALIIVPLWLIPESIPWLVCKGRKKAAHKLLHKMARLNNRVLPDDIDVTVEKEVDKTSTRVLNLVRTRNMRKTTFILSFNWFTDALLFYAINWNSIALHGNLYINVFLSGFIEIPSYFLNIVVLQCLGRRLSMSGCTLLAGLALLVTLSVPKGLGGLLTVLTLISKFFITMAFTTAYQYTTELYPTVIRALGLNCCNFAARFGVLTASYMPLMVTEEMQFKKLPQLMCGVLAVLAAVSLLFLPETLGQTLPATTEEADEMHSNYKMRDVFKIPSKLTATKSDDESVTPLRTQNTRDVMLASIPM